MKSTKTIACAIAMFGAITQAPCQQLEIGVTVDELAEPTLLAYGEHTAGARIGTAVDIDRFEFCGAAGDPMQIICQATFDGMDPFVELYDPAGAKVSSVVCSNGCSVVLAETLTLSGKYTILVSDSGANEVGNYVLQLERTPPHLNAPSLLYNTTYTDKIDRGTDVDFVMFAAQAGALVRLTVTATFDGMDPVVSIHKPDGTVVHTLSCSNGCATNHTWTLAETGTYFLKIRDSGHNEGGNYQLSLNQLVGTPPGHAGSAWTNLGEALAGSRGKPVLYGDGTMLGNTQVSLYLDKVVQSGFACLAAGATRADMPFLGGMLVPAPEVVVSFQVDAQGKYTVQVPWPDGVPSGLTTYFQAWIPDLGGPMGVAASNAVLSVTP